MTEAGMRDARSELTHVSGLDGLRGLAVTGVVLYDGGVSWARGGFLGGELCFALSGFLITSLLLRGWLERGAVAVSDFWVRRGRRLLPAPFRLVIVIGIYYAVRGSFGAVPGLFGDGPSALLGYANWHQFAVGSSISVLHGANAEVLDIDKVISPNHRYTDTINGRGCRADGIHFLTHCADLLEKPIFTAVRRLLNK